MAWQGIGAASARLALALAVAIPLAVWPTSSSATELARDAKYLVDNTQLDVVDILTSPLHAADPTSVLRSPTFYLVLGGVAGVWAGSFALDQTIRSHLRSMSASDADLLQHVSYASVGAAADRTRVRVRIGILVGVPLLVRIDDVADQPVPYDVRAGQLRPDGRFAGRHVGAAHHLDGHRPGNLFRVRVPPQRGPEKRHRAGGCRRHAEEMSRLAALT